MERDVSQVRAVAGEEISARCVEVAGEHRVVLDRTLRGGPALLRNAHRLPQCESRDYDDAEQRAAEQQRAGPNGSHATNE